MRHTPCAKTVAMLLCCFACIVNHSSPQKLTFGQCSHYAHTDKKSTNRKRNIAQSFNHSIRHAAALFWFMHQPICKPCKTSLTNQWMQNVSYTLPTVLQVISLSTSLIHSFTNNTHDSNPLHLSRLANNASLGKNNCQLLRQLHTFVNNLWNF